MYLKSIHSRERLEPRKKTGWLGYKGDYTTEIYRDYNNPL